MLSLLLQRKNTLRTLQTHSWSRSSMTCPLSMLPQPSPRQTARFSQAFQVLKLFQGCPQDQTCLSPASSCQASSTRLSVQSAVLTFPRQQRSGSSKAASPRRTCLSASSSAKTAGSSSEKPSPETSSKQPLRGNLSPPIPQFLFSLFFVTTVSKGLSRENLCRSVTVRIQRG